ncbi:aspartyl/glutamyl-tRNA amidotransferase subunit C [Streptomyces goshikiensis]
MGGPVVAGRAHPRPPAPPPLDDIIGAVARVSEVADQDVPPTSHPLPLTNVMRADEVRPSLTPAQALSGAPAQEQQRFKVPQILGED